MTQAANQQTVKETLLQTYGVSPTALLNRGMEAEVYLYNNTSVLKLYSNPATGEQLPLLQHFYQTVDRSLLPYALPDILTIDDHGEYMVVVEKRLQGEPMSTYIGKENEPPTEALLHHYITATQALSRVTMPATVDRYKLFDPAGISSRQAGDWHHFLLDYLSYQERSLFSYFRRDVDDYEAKRQHMRDLLSKPYGGPHSLIHGDIFPGNWLVDANGQPTALIDFGLFTMYGDPLFDLATACAFFDMYDELNLNLRMGLFDLVCAQIGEDVRPLLYRYLLLYSFLAANTYSPDCSDGHYAWSVANLNNRDYWSLVI